MTTLTCSLHTHMKKTHFMAKKYWLQKVLKSPYFDSTKSCFQQTCESLQILLLYVLFYFENNV